MAGKRKRTICSIYLLPTDQVTEEDMRDLLEKRENSSNFL